MASAAEHQHPALNGNVNDGRPAASSDQSRTEPFPDFDPQLQPSGGTAAQEPRAREAAAQPRESVGDVEASDGESAREGAHGEEVGAGRDGVDAAGITTPCMTSHGSSPVTSPPYWSHVHRRAPSQVSVESELPAGAITLQDNEAEDGANNGYANNGSHGRGASGGSSYGQDRNRSCWAKSVQVTDHVVVNGSATNIGAFVVWNIKVETLTVCPLLLRTRHLVPAPTLE